MQELIITCIKAALDAGKCILDVYGKDDFQVEQKDDNSPLTIADLNANDAIKAHLCKTNIPILSEEGKQIAYNVRKNWSRFWLVDPLDGTKEFIKRNGEFTVNIALVQSGIPILGFVYVPVKKELYFTMSQSKAYKANNVDSIMQVEEIIKRANPLPLKTLNSNFVVVASKSHLSDETQVYINMLKEKHDEVEFISKGSSLKICMVAEGTANIYPRLGPTMEWDTAAAHAVALAAGKKVYRYDNGQVLTYNKENLLNPFFIVE